MDISKQKRSELQQFNSSKKHASHLPLFIYFFVSSDILNRGGPYIIHTPSMQKLVQIHRVVLVLTMTIYVDYEKA